MFDLNADDGSVRKLSYKSPVPDGDQPGAQAVRPNALDSEPMVQMHRRLLSYYTDELDKQFDNRLERATDDDFYDNDQWDAEDKAEVEARGQKPIVYNVISASIDWVTGTERRTRSDFSVLPRRKDDGKAATRKTELLKYLSDVNRSPFHKSRAFADAVKSGLGWIEAGITDTDEDEPLYDRYENWRCMLHDSSATELDLNDGRYLFRAKWFDEDIALALFSSRSAIISSSIGMGDQFSTLIYGDEAMDSQELAALHAQPSTADRINGYQRRRLRIMEGWIRIPVKAKRLKGGPFNGELYDPYSEGHNHTLKSGDAEVIVKPTMRMHCGIFSQAGMLWFGESPYRHNKFPFTPIWGKRRAKDGLPYGMIRGLRDIQEDINKRASKATYILSTNKVIMDTDALDPEVMDIDEFREEVARPDAILFKKRGSEVDLNVDRDLSQYQLELMSRSIQIIQSASGVTDELLGRETGAKSGIAIQRRQDQGSMATAQYFDNLRLAYQLHGEKMLANIEQFMDAQKQFRITNERGQPQYIDVNDGLPENDIVRTKADFIISDADWHATQRQAAVDQLLEVAQKFPPNIVLLMLDLMVENMDLPNRDELVKRIRSLTGMKDPDAGDEPPSPEDQAKAAAQAEAAQIQKAGLLVELRKKTAEAAKAEAQADQIAASIAGTKIDAQGRALEVAGAALTLPPAAVHTADHILTAVGAGADEPDVPGAADEPEPPMPGGTPMAPPASAPPAPQPQPIA